MSTVEKLLLALGIDCIMGLRYAQDYESPEEAYNNADAHYIACLLVRLGFAFSDVVALALQHGAEMPKYTFPATAWNAYALLGKPIGNELRAKFPWPVVSEKISEILLDKPVSAG